MDNPGLSFYTSGLLYIGSTYKYSSLRWENATNRAGDIEIHIPYEFIKDIFAYVALDGFLKIHRPVKEQYAIIKHIELSVDQSGVQNVVFIGKTFSYLLSDRVPSLISAAEYETGSLTRTNDPYNLFKNLILSSFSYGNLNTSRLTFFDGNTYENLLTDTANYTFQSSLTDTHTMLTSLAQERDFCFYCLPYFNSANGEIYFKSCVYGYTENTHAIFDYALGNISTISYIRSNDAQKTDYYYLKKNVNQSIVNDEVVETYNYDNILTNKNNGNKVVWIGVFEETSEASAEGLRKIRELVPKESIEADVSSYYYKYLTDYNVGDIVKIRNSAWGLSVMKKITAVSESWENGTNYNCQITFGDEQYTVYGKLKKQLS